MTDYGWVCLSCGNHLLPTDGPSCSCGTSNFLHDRHASKPTDPIAEAKRIIAESIIPMTLTVNDRIVPIEVLEALIARAELAGAVTPGPSARQIIRERIGRLAEGQID